LLWLPACVAAVTKSAASVAFIPGEVPGFPAMGLDAGTDASGQPGVINGDGSDAFPDGITGVSIAMVISPYVVAR
jgi:hypothetical protein